MLPSLKADSGSIVGQPITFTTIRYDKICRLAALSMRMETAAILKLRRILDPQNAAHKAIFRASIAAMRSEQTASSPIGDLLCCAFSTLFSHVTVPIFSLLEVARNAQFQSNARLSEVIIGCICYDISLTML